MMMSCSLVTPLTLLLLVASTGNSFEVMNTQSPLVTQTGCTILLTCGGFGQSIEWRRFGESVALEVNENQTTSSILIEPDNNTSLPYLISNATLIASPSIHLEKFICYIFGGPDGRTISHQVQLRVEPSVVVINPSIPNYNISTSHEDSPLTIGCPVQTCAEKVTVKFLRGEEVLSTTEADSTQPTAYNLQLRVSDSIVGAYACKVDTVNPDGSTIMQFEVEGTPLPPIPTTQPPATTSSPSTGTAGTTEGTGGTGGEDDNNDSAAVLGRLSGLSILLVLLPVHHLCWP